MMCRECERVLYFCDCVCICKMLVAYIPISIYTLTIESSAHNNAITLHTIENNLNGHIATYFIFGLVDGLTGHGNILIISIPLHVNLYHKNRRSSAQAIYPPQKLCIYSPLLSSLDSAFFTYKRLNRLLALSLSLSLSLSPSLFLSPYTLISFMVVSKQLTYSNSNKDNNETYK